MSNSTATKSALIAKVNAEFPETWQWVIENNPKTHPPKFDSYPALVSVVVGEITHAHGTEADIIACFKKADGVEYQLKGVFIDNDFGSEVFFTDRRGNWGTVEEQIVEHLFGNELCEAGFDFLDWKNLAS